VHDLGKLLESLTDRLFKGKDMLRDANEFRESKNIHH
jgi:hypothetical protein